MKTKLLIAALILSTSTAYGQSNDDLILDVLIQGQLAHQRVMNDIDQIGADAAAVNREQARVSNAINWNNNQNSAAALGVAPVNPYFNPYQTAPINSGSQW